MSHQPFFNYPDLSTFQTELMQALEKAETDASELAKASSPTWKTQIHPLDEQANALHILWSSLAHLHHVADNPEIRTLYEACLPLLIAYQSRQAQREDLYHLYQAVLSQDPTLTPTQTRSLKQSIRAFELAGVHLPSDKKVQYQALNQKLGEASTQFQQHLLDAKEAWFYPINDLNLLAGLPEHTLHYATEEAKKRHLTGWCLTLEAPCYLAVLSYAQNRDLREICYQAYVTRASDLDKPDFDNSDLMRAILEDRHALAELLNFPHYAAYSLATKMLKQPKEVVDFIAHLIHLAKPKAEEEFEALTAFAQSIDGLDKLAPWDLAYYSEKLQQAEYAFNSETLRPYFPTEKVLQGFFRLVHTLYGIQFESIDLPVWHSDVRCFKLSQNDGTTVGYVYLDLYARTGKQGGAWMDDLCGRYRRLNGDLQYPVAFLTCNFTPATAGQPACLNHDEVLTLFHEFGHGLHHLLTQIEVLDISGINGVEWDAVELPSQLMENFCWEKEILIQLSAHIETGEPLPEPLIVSLQRSQYFQAGLQLMRQLEFALFDFKLHQDFTPKVASNFIQAQLDAVREQVSVVPIASFNRFQHGFSHIFAGGYAAGYYSYKWAEVLSADSFSYFKEQGINRQSGQHFLESLLSQGSLEDMAVLFERFRGRSPQLEPLLQQTGLAPW